MVGANPDHNNPDSIIPGVDPDQPYQTGDFSTPGKQVQDRGFIAGIARLLQNPKDFIWFANKKLKEK
ncbi:MAG: hypothetical protein ACE5DX_02450 [Candidatus Dojkabacteria bacterium]